MEGRSSIKAGVLVWTPAPRYSSSPLSPDRSQLSWDEGRDEDFQSQMDENGIIGLREVDKKGDLGSEEEEDFLLNAGTPEPEEGPPLALEDLSSQLIELLDSEPLSQPTGIGCISPSHGDDNGSVALENWSDDEEKSDEELPQSLTIPRLQPDSKPVGKRLLSMASDETKKAKGHRVLSFSFQEGMNQQYNWMEGHDDGGNERNENLTSSRNDGTSSENMACSENGYKQEYGLNEIPNMNTFPIFTHAPVFQNLSELSLVKQVYSLENEAPETSPELVYAESIAESHSSQLSCFPRTYQPIRFEEDEPKCQIRAQFVKSPRLKEDTFLKKISMPPDTLNQPSIISSHKINPAPQAFLQSSSPIQPTAKVQSSSSDSSPLSTPHHRRHRGHRPAKPSPADITDMRNGQKSHPMPDFSKVEPKVRFPKNSYKPPRSRRPSRKRDSKPDFPLPYRSPADIVREVLLSSTEGLSDTAASGDPQRALKSTMTEEASTLVQQLQEDYNRLLTKYAEAENTIDRLRLEAKVSLYSDPPKPSLPALHGVLQEGSKVMTLSFPQAQRAELNADHLHAIQNNNISEFSRETPIQLSSVDFVSSSMPKVQRFQLQVDEFEEILKSGKLQTYDQKQGLSHLAQGQESLEKAYLTARDQYQQLQKETGGKSGCFDPDRELESLIFNSGMRLEELKERIEQSEQNQHTSELVPSPPPHTHKPYASLNEIEPQPKSPVSAVHVDGMVGLEVSSISGDSGGEKEEHKEEILRSLLHPLHQKHQHVEKDFSNLMDQYQNFRELPELLDRGLHKETHDSLEFLDAPSQLVSNDRTENGQQWRTKNEGDSCKLIQQFPTADTTSCPSGSSHGFNSIEMASLPATTVPEQQECERRPAAGRKSHNTLGMERNPKDCDRVQRAPLQDGVISPETDSGFVGSESSRHTPAAHSPLQQRAAERVTKPSVTQEKCRIQPGTEPVSGQPAPGFLSPSHSGGGAGSTKKSSRKESQYLHSPSTSSSPLRWPSSGISEQEQPSDSVQSLSGEEARQGDQHMRPAIQKGCYLRSPSPSVQYHHGDRLKDQSSVQLMDRHEALQSLQEEVNSLRERLEGSLRMNNPSSPLRAPPLVLKDLRNHKPSHTSTPQQPYFGRPSEQRASSKRGPRQCKSSEGEEEEEEEERRRTPKPVPRRRSASMPRFRPELDSTTDSEPKPQISRNVPASLSMAHGSRRVRAETGRGTASRTNRQQCSTWSDRSDEGDEEAEGSRGQPHLCMCCMARHGSGSSSRVARNISSPTHTRHYTRQCPLCGTRVFSPGNQNSAPRETKPVSSKHRDRGGVYLAAAPPPPVLGSVHVLQCVPVCPPFLYYSSPLVPSSYSNPLYLSPSEERGNRAGVRGHYRRSRSLDTQHALRNSLDQAVAAASSMREVSRHMASSLASGLKHRSPLIQSCIY